MSLKCYETAMSTLETVCKQYAENEIEFEQMCKSIDRVLGNCQDWELRGIIIELGMKVCYAEKRVEDRDKTIDTMMRIMFED